MQTEINYEDQYKKSTKFWMMKLIKKKAKNDSIKRKKIERQNFFLKTI
jgi:hypothetical protein